MDSQRLVQQALRGGFIGSSSPGDRHREIRRSPGCSLTEHRRTASLYRTIVAGHRQSLSPAGAPRGSKQLNIKKSCRCPPRNMPCHRPLPHPRMRNRPPAPARGAGGQCRPGKGYRERLWTPFREVGTQAFFLYNARHRFWEQTCVVTVKKPSPSDPTQSPADAGDPLSSAAALRELFDALEDGVLLVTEKGMIRAHNAAASRLLQGHPAASLQQQNLLEWFDRSRKLARRLVAAARGTPQVLEHEAYRHGTGEKFEAWLTARPLRVDCGDVVMVTLRDISAHRARERALMALASTDDLTGLYNRRYFLELLRRELERSRRYRRPLSLLMIDVDHFKRVNDRFGHAAGDSVLWSLAHVGQQCFREFDGFGRLGGEEFAVILTETDAPKAMTVAERYRRQVAQTTFRVKKERVVVTVSIGITTLSPADGSLSAEELIQRADEALYRAKTQGRNRCIPSQPAS